MNTLTNNPAQEDESPPADYSFAIGPGDLDLSDLPGLPSTSSASEGLSQPGDSYLPPLSSSSALQFYTGHQPSLAPVSSIGSDDESSIHSNSPSGTFSISDDTNFNNHSVAGDEPHYELPRESINMLLGSEIRGDISTGLEARGPPAVVLRGQFDVDSSRPQRTEALTSSQIWNYPPLEEQHFASFDNGIFDPRPDHTSTIELGDIARNFVDCTERLEGRLHQRALKSQQIQDQIKEKRESIRYKKTWLQRQSQSLDEKVRQIFVTDVADAVGALEDEVRHLEELLHMRRLKSEAIITQSLGYEYREPLLEPPKFGPKMAMLVNSAGPASYAPRLLVDHYEIDDDNKEPCQVLIPDWFAVFTSFDILRLSENKSMEYRFCELLNTIHQLERRIESLSMASQVAWHKKWHEPNPKWTQRSQQKHGG